MKIFLDSSVVFTATHSPTGGSAKIFSLAGKKLRLLVSPVVLTEVERNVRKKLTDKALERFFWLIKRLIIIKQTPKIRLINQARKVIVRKDAVILAEAKQARVDYLLTLDRKHFLTKKAKKFIQPTKILTPGELLCEFLGVNA